MKLTRLVTAMLIGFAFTLSGYAEDVKGLPMPNRAWLSEDPVHIKINGYDDTSFYQLVQTGLSKPLMLHTYSATNGKRLSSEKIESKRIQMYSIAGFSDKTGLVLVDENGKLVAYEIDSWNKRYDIPGKKDSGDIIYEKKSDLLFVPMNRKVEVYRGKTGQKLSSLDIPAIKTMFYHPNKQGVYLVTGKKVYHYNSAQNKIINSFKDIFKYITYKSGSGFSAKINYVITGQWHENGKLYVISDGIGCIDLKKDKPVWHEKIKTNTRMGSFLGSMVLSSLLETDVNIKSKQVIIRPEFYKDTIIINDVDGNLLALNKDTGKEKWKYRGSDTIYTKKVMGNTVFAIGESSLLRINADTGKEVYKVKSRRDFEGYYTSGNEVHVFDDRTFYSYNISNGDLIVEKDAKKDLNLSGGITEVNVLQNGRYVFLFNKSSVALFDPRKKDIVYQTDLNIKKESLLTAFIKGGSLIFLPVLKGYGGNAVYLYSLNISSGKINYALQVDQLDKSGNSTTGFMMFPKLGIFTRIEKDGGFSIGFGEKRIAGYRLD